MLSTQARARTGWAPEETEMMWNEVRRVGAGGATLKSAFEAIAEKTGRKPDSIRNYYYQSLKTEDAPEELRLIRAQPFVPFTQEEVENMLREILISRANGESVRACVQRLGGGDRSLALRYQNKYRSILKNRPDLIEKSIASLREEGVDCPNPYDTLRVNRTSKNSGMAKREGDISADQLLRAMREMIVRQDREESMRHREEMDRMSVRCDLLRLELARRDELLALAQAREEVSARSILKAKVFAESCQELLTQKDIENARDKVKQALGALEGAGNLPDTVQNIYNGEI